jgi:hypothetical protein
MAKRGGSRARAPKAETGPSVEEIVDEVTGKIVVKYATDAQGKAVTGIAVGPNKYDRRADGTFLIYRKDFEEVARQGLIRA